MSEESKHIVPNTFLLGAQKAATTSVYGWLSQHPEICAPMATKDLGYFTREDMYPVDGLEGLSKYYEEVYQGQKVIINGSVHYIFFEKALQRIAAEVPEAKCILIVRNPVDRAISAYRYAHKFNFEELDVLEALKAEEDRMASGDHRTLSELTYKQHGLYYRQIQTFLKYFDRSQLKVILYQDVAEKPGEVARELFEFLNVDPSFEPEYKVLNTTGKVKNQTLQKVAFGDSPIRNFFVRKVLRLVLSEDAWAKLRWKVIHMNTQDTTSEEPEDIQQARAQLADYFREDTARLEEFLNKDLSQWK